MPALCGSVSIVCSIACLGRDACLVDHINNQSHKSQSEQVTKNGPYLLSGSIGLMTAVWRAAISLATVIVMSSTFLLLVSFLCQVYRILQPTGASQNVRIVRVSVPFTSHFYCTKAVSIVHVSLTLPLYIIAIRPSVVTLDNLRLKGIASSSSPNTFQLWNS